MSSSKSRKGKGSPPAAPSAHEAEDCQSLVGLADDLLRTIEADIIPRLLLSHEQGKASRLPAGSPSAKVLPADVKRLSVLCRSDDSGAAWACTQEIRQRGVPLEAVFLDLLAPVARHLGKLWEDDLIDFTAVAIALLRLQHILRELAPAFAAARERTIPRPPPRILLAGLPGEQHRLGLLMVGEFLRADGWDVSQPAEDTTQAIVGQARRIACDVVGFSLGSLVGLEQLRDLIVQVKRVSLNPTVKVMVGGPIFVEDSARAALLGADACARDAKEAVRTARELLRSVESAELGHFPSTTVHPTHSRRH